MAKEGGSLDNRLPKKQCLMKGECFSENTWQIKHHIDQIDDRDAL